MQIGLRAESLALNSWPLGGLSVNWTELKPSDSGGSAGKLMSSCHLGGSTKEGKTQPSLQSKHRKCKPVSVLTLCNLSQRAAAFPCAAWAAGLKVPQRCHRFNLPQSHSNTFKGGWREAAASPGFLPKRSLDLSVL